MRMWVVMFRWPKHPRESRRKWMPWSIHGSLDVAMAAMREQFDGTIAERRVQRARLER